MIMDNDTGTEFEEFVEEVYHDIDEEFFNSYERWLIGISCRKILYCMFGKCTSVINAANLLQRYHRRNISQNSKQTK